jgi:hypothetical protein
MTATYTAPGMQCTVFAIDPNTLSPEENYRINGTLPAYQIEELLEYADLASVLCDVDAHLCDIDGGPEEDFASGILADLGTIADGMRAGPRRDKLRAAIADLEELQGEIGRATEFNNEGIKKARNLIDAAQR